LIKVYIPLIPGCNTIIQNLPINRERNPHDQHIWAANMQGIATMNVCNILRSILA